MADWLCANFSKFTEENKLRVALEITKKGMPQLVKSEHSGEVTQKIVVEHTEVNERAACYSRN